MAGTFSFLVFSPFFFFFCSCVVWFRLLKRTLFSKALDKGQMMTSVNARPWGTRTFTALQYRFSFFSLDRFLSMSPQTKKNPLFSADLWFKRKDFWDCGKVWFRTLWEWLRQGILFCSLLFFPVCVVTSFFLSFFQEQFILQPTLLQNAFSHRDCTLKKALGFSCWVASQLVFSFLSLFVLFLWLKCLCILFVEAMTVATVTSPIWLVKTRMQLQAHDVGQVCLFVQEVDFISNSSCFFFFPRIQGVLYKNTWDCVKVVYAQEGVKGFYKGLTASYVGAYFAELFFLRIHPLFSFVVWMKRNHRICIAVHVLWKTERAGSAREISSLWKATLENSYLTFFFSFCISFFFLFYLSPFAAKEVTLSSIEYLTVASLAKFAASFLTYPHEVQTTNNNEKNTRTLIFLFLLFPCPGDSNATQRTARKYVKVQRSASRTGGDCPWRRAARTVWRNGSTSLESCSQRLHHVSDLRTCGENADSLSIHAHTSLSLLFFPPPIYSLFFFLFFVFELRYPPCFCWKTLLLR